MRCLSCQVDCPGTQLKIRNTLLLCPSCDALAEKAEAEIDREINRAREATKNWLTQHILRGGLLRGGSGVEEVLGQYRSHVRDVHDEAPVPGVQRSEGHPVLRQRNPEGNNPGS